MRRLGGGVTRREIVTTVAVVAVLWLLFSSSWALVPFRLLVTLIHEANHAVAAELVGGDVQYVIVNEHGGGLTRWSYEGRPSDLAVIVVSSAGYVGTAVVGALLLEASSRLRRGRVATIGLVVLVAAIALAWVPWSVDPGPSAAVLSTGSSSGDGRFTVVVCVLAIAALVGIAVQPNDRLRRLVITGLATTFCLASVDDMRRVLDWSSRGGHSDAAIAAEVSWPSSWMWAGLWLVAGVGACVLGVWAALSGDGNENEPRMLDGPDR